jgi:hypothetical protein
MSATVIRDRRFQDLIDVERARPLQRNLFTGEAETLKVDVYEDLPEDETILDKGISVVKTDDMAQLIVSGFGLYLGKKSERLIVPKDKTAVYQFPFFPHSGGCGRFTRDFNLRRSARRTVFGGFD